MWRTVPVGGMAGGGPARPSPIFGTHILTLGRTNRPAPRCPMGVLNEGEGGGSGAAGGGSGAAGPPGGAAGRPGRGCYNRTMNVPAASGADADSSPLPRRARRLRAEVWIVLGLSLGQSALYAVVNIIARLTAETALRDQATAINPSRSPRPYLDLTYQLLAIGFALVPVALTLFLLSEPGRRATARIGLTLARPGRDLAVGTGLAALIGIPGLGLYALGRAVGVTVEVQAATLDAHWWAVPVLILAALKNALVEEVIAAGYLIERLEDLGWRPGATVAASAVLRGAYHLYQGIGPFFANIAMGVIFALYYRRRRRTMPLEIGRAHV